MLMMRPARRGAAGYQGCRTANIIHLDFGDWSNDASCRLVWTYGGLVTKIGSGDACDACVNRCERKETDAACQWEETHWREEVPQIRSQSGNFRWLRFLLLCILHSVTSWHCNSFLNIQYPASDVESYICQTQMSKRCDDRVLDQFMDRILTEPKTWYGCSISDKT